MKKGVIVTVSLVLAVAAIASFLLLERREPVTHDITVTARKFGFTPSVISVRKGDTVVLTLAPEDVMHGIYLDAYGLSVQAAPGATETIIFEASRTGKSLFRCSTTCGTFHPYMIGWLRVGPNLPLVAGLWLTVLSAWFVLVYASRRSRIVTTGRIAA